ncbi:MAG: 50S ribosomal protein L6 [Nitrospiraceae bacterium]
MSRIGKKILQIPTGVDVKVAGNAVTVKGPLGQLTWPLAQGLSVAVQDNKLNVSRQSDERNIRAMHGLTRAELGNMVTGVTKGYEKTLEINGVGYKAQLQGKTMSFNVGYINPVEFPLPTGIDAKIDKQTVITLRGIDKRLVGQVAAKLRAIKPPDVYKQKGIKYAGEALRKKEGKTGK